MPFLSVLIPVYNGEHYLAQAITSVLEQPCRDLELIIANDGSTDSSPEIANGFAQKDERVRVVSHENCGPGMTRNKALPLMSGTWALFLDCDDIVLPGFYTEQMKAFLGACLQREVETIVPARLYANVDLTRANLDTVPFDEAFPRGCDASWSVNAEFATLLYSLDMLRREHIEFGVTRPAEMESLFKHKAIFCSRRSLFTNSLWFAVRRDNPYQTTKAKNWDTVLVDQIRYDAYDKLIDWHREHGTTGFVIEEAARRKQAAANAIERSKERKSIFARLKEQRQRKADRENWEKSHQATERPIEEFILDEEQQRDAIQAAWKLVEK